MRTHSIIFSILFLTLSKVTSSCDCDPQGDFFAVAPKTKLVALVKVTKYLTFANIQGTKIPMSMNVEILKIYKGKESRSLVKVWGDNGILCRPYLSNFDTGQVYLIAFDKGEPEVHSIEKSTDYCISMCGIYFLRTFTKNNILTFISEFPNNPPDTISLTTIENFFKKSNGHK